jgi:hypothetical protein
MQLLNAAETNTQRWGGMTMFYCNTFTRKLSALAVSFAGLTLCMGSGGGMSSGGCDATDADMMDIMFGDDGSAVSPTGTGGPTDPLSPPAQAAPLTVSVSASATEVDSGQMVTLTSSTTGGTPPYYIYWMAEGDSGWTLGGISDVRTISGTPGQARTIYCQVVDTAGVNSNLAAVTITIRQAAGANCDAMGRWRTAQGFVNFTSATGGTFGHVDGTFQDVADGMLVGGFSVGIEGCRDCTVFTGTWMGSDGNSGSVQFTFNNDCQTFDGKWSWAGNSYWDASPWDGFRN